MNVVVKYSAQVKKAAGCATESLALEEPCNVRKMLDSLIEKYGAEMKKHLLLDDGTIRPTTLLFVGENKIDENAAAHELKDGDTVTILPPIAGG